MSWRCWRGARRGGEGMSTETDWEGDWYEITSESERCELDEELRREVCPEHPLYGIESLAVGRRYRRDDVLFRLGDGRYAQVHLTRRKETSPDWPSTDIYDSLDDWRSVPVVDR